jgi:hypothetical protein
LATKLTVIFSAWSAAALLFITANASLGLNYLDVDQVSIRLLLALQPLARVVHYLPAKWIPALVAAAFVAVLGLPALRARQADHGNSRSTRLVPRVLGPFTRVIAWLHSSRAGSRVVGLLPAVGNAVGAVKAIAVGLLAFGLGAGVQTVGFVRAHAAALEALSAAAVRAEVEWNKVTGHILVATVIRELEETAREEERCGTSDGRADGACADQPTTLPGSLLRTIYQRPTPYTPPPSPPRSGDPAGRPDSPSGVEDLGHGPKLPRVHPTVTDRSSRPRRRWPESGWPTISCTISAWPGTARLRRSDAAKFKRGWRVRPEMPAWRAFVRPVAIWRDSILLPQRLGSPT